MKNFGSLGPLGNKGLSKGDWTPLAKTNGYILWEVLTKEGASHAVVTTKLLGKNIILEVDGEKVW